VHVPSPPEQQRRDSYRGCRAVAGFATSLLRV
jgi:hypothetical protein